MIQSKQATAAKKTLLHRRGTLSRLSSDKNRSVVALDSEKRPDELAENHEIADVLVKLSERESTDLVEVDAALERLEQGSWGRCEKCGGMIAARRLRVLPEARSCVSCVS